MKNIALYWVLTLALVGNFAMAQSVTPDVVHDGFKGQVKKVTEKIYDAEGDAKNPEKGMQIQNTDTRYDNTGRKKVITFYTDENNVIFKTRYKRDAIGNLILEQFINPQGDVIGRTYYSYDTKNVLKQIYVFDGETQLENRTLLKYNEQGHLCEKSLSDSYNDILDKEIYTLNASGLPSKTSVYNRQKKLAEEILYEYDSHNQIITVTRFDYTEKEAEVSTTLFEYSYDDRGNWVERYEYAVDGDKIEPVTIIERNIEYFN